MAYLELLGTAAQPGSFNVSGVGDAQPMSMGDGHFLLVWASFHDVLAEVWRVQNGALQRVTTAQSVAGPKTGIDSDGVERTQRLRTFYAAHLVQWGFTPFPTATGVAFTVQYEWPAGRREFRLIHVRMVNGVFTTSSQDVYTETVLADGSRSANDWGGPQSIYAGQPFFPVAVSNDEVVLATTFGHWSGFFYGVATRRINIAGGASSSWVEAHPFADDRVEIVWNPMDGVRASASGIVIFIETHDPNFNAQNGRVAYIDSASLTITYDIEIPVVVDGQDDKIWKKNSGGYALIVNSSAPFAQVVNVSGTSTDLVYVSRADVAVDGFQYMVSPPRRLCGDDVWTMTRDGLFDIVDFGEATPVVPPEETLFTAAAYYLEILHDGQHIVTWGQNFDTGDGVLHLVKHKVVSQVLDMRLRDSRMAFKASTL